MYQRILVPVDGSPTSDRGVDEAIRLADLTGASLRLVPAVDDLSFATGLEPAAVHAGDLIPLLREADVKVPPRAQARAAAAGISADTALLESFAGRLSDFVVERALAWQAELIAISTHGRLTPAGPRSAAPRRCCSSAGRSAGGRR
jgi:nucleotide-binding universal stress UspA family protein